MRKAERKNKSSAATKGKKPSSPSPSKKPNTKKPSVTNKPKASRSFGNSKTVPKRGRK
jgi:hypothetical protein